MKQTLASWEKEVIRCIRCGACQSVCPVFKELQAEASVARGRVMLIRAVINKDSDLTDGFREKMSLCLMCKACVANCPSGVKVDKVVEAARAEIVRKQGLPFLKRLIFRFVLKNRWVFNFAMRMGSAFQGLVFRKGPHGQGMLPRMPLGLDRRRLLAPLAPQSFRSQYPEVVKVEDAKKRVAFFTGCMINYIYTDTGRAVVNVLKRNGIEVVIPALQNCCGAPVRINGDYESARDMARANINVFLREQVDTVVVACGTCGLTLKEEYAELLADDPVYAEKAKKLGAKVQDITEVLVSLDGFRDKIQDEFQDKLLDGTQGKGLPFNTELSRPKSPASIGGGRQRAVKSSMDSTNIQRGLNPPLNEVSFKVTYHDPCHLVRGLKVKEQPRQIIRSIPGVEFVEMAKPDTCCGSGGSFSLYHYNISAKINDHKIEDIKQTGAEVLVTGCSACRMHIADGLSRQHAGVKVMHTVQLLEMAYEVDR
ncbi:(Fe-S)-binding protein [Paradesulfitobacterium ferrireducens]|uniref:(Fe-S)-binding protein n=1 Tax=Paradesulfitobacterium ferrireducens TaxID=2816476 RepID=UPI001F31B02E|nr:(Fe-S)-binding protein [Paradesulfitobacterium ferrireducens]